MEDQKKRINEWKSYVCPLFSVFFLGLLSMISCNSDRKCFRLLNGEIIKQTSVQEIENIDKVNFSQYEGFVISSKDSLFNKAILEIENGAIKNDVLNKEKIEELKNEKIISIKYTYNSKLQLDTANVKDHLLKKFDDCVVENIGDNTNYYNKEGALVAKLEYFHIIKPIAFLSIFPTDLCDE